MKKKTIEARPLSSLGNISFSNLEEFARQRIQGWLQGLLEEEVTAYFGREKYERSKENSDNVVLPQVEKGQG